MAEGFEVRLAPDAVADLLYRVPVGRQRVADREGDRLVIGAVLRAGHHHAGLGQRQLLTAHGAQVVRIGDFHVVARIRDHDVARPSWIASAGPNGPAVNLTCLLYTSDAAE